MTGTQNSQSRPADMATKRITLHDDHTMTPTTSVARVPLYIRPTLPTSLGILQPDELNR